jgi:hypothetical protein
LLEREWLFFGKGGPTDETSWCLGALVVQNFPRRRSSHVSSGTNKISLLRNYPQMNADAGFAVAQIKKSETPLSDLHPSASNCGK